MTAPDIQATLVILSGKGCKARTGTSDGIEFQTKNMQLFKIENIVLGFKPSKVNYLDLVVDLIWPGKRVRNLARPTCSKSGSADVFEIWLGPPAGPRT